MKACKTVVKRRREPDEFPTATVAIRNFCLECVGYNHAEVTKCTDPGCWLFPRRERKTPPELVSDAKRESGKRLARSNTAPQTST